jgi:hypothetical protein
MLLLYAATALSIGAIYSFIPIIIILLLIGAAVGLSRGSSIFAFLGLGALASRAAYGGGVGKAVTGKGTKFGGAGATGTAAKAGSTIGKSTISKKGSAEISKNIQYQKDVRAAEVGILAGTAVAGSSKAASMAVNSNTAKPSTGMRMAVATPAVAFTPVKGAKTPLPALSKVANIGSTTIKNPSNPAETANVTILSSSKPAVTNVILHPIQTGVNLTAAVLSAAPASWLGRPAPEGGSRFKGLGADLRNAAMERKRNRYETRENKKLEKDNSRETDRANKDTLALFHKHASKDEIRNVRNQARTAVAAGFTASKKGSNAFEEWKNNLQASGKSMPAPPMPMKQSTVGYFAMANPFSMISASTRQNKTKMYDAAVKRSGEASKAESNRQNILLQRKQVSLNREQARAQKAQAKAMRKQSRKNP